MSSTVAKIRLIDDPPALGAWNMAVDQAILERANDADEALPTLRIYRWQPATLSLGYFQKFDDRQQHPPSVDCDVVRRASGGGAILHDQEVTYSLVMPSRNRWAAANSELYAKVHESIIRVLGTYGVQSHLFGDATDHNDGEPKHFLCFKRRSDGDIVFRDQKVVGSAQRRYKKAILQHGSILLETSAFAPELPGVFELLGDSFDASDFAEKFVQEVCRELGFVADSGTLSDAECSRARELEHSKFETDDWTVHRRKS